MESHSSEGRPPVERCISCSGAVFPPERGMYLYGTWFHAECYERENGFPFVTIGLPSHERPRAVAAARPKDPLAVALGRRGGLKGGRARATRLSPPERTELARKAARARWAKRAGTGADNSAATDIVA
jgi:hypothetical protein